MTTRATCRRFGLPVGLSVALLVVIATNAQRGDVDWDAVEIATHHVRGTVHYVTGQGANIFRDMVIDVGDKVSELVGQGMTYEQVAAANPTAAYEAKWGSPERFLTAVYEELNSGN